MIPSIFMNTPYIETATSPPRWSSRLFMNIEVILPDVLFRKLGSPWTNISLSVSRTPLSRVKRRAILPLMNGIMQMMQVMDMPRLVPRAAKPIPRSNMQRKMNSRTRQRSAMTIFIIMENLTLPQILR